MARVAGEIGKRQGLGGIWKPVYPLIVNVAPRAPKPHSHTVTAITATIFRVDYTKPAISEKRIGERDGSVLGKPLRARANERQGFLGHCRSGNGNGRHRIWKGQTNNVRLAIPGKAEVLKSRGMARVRSIPNVATGT